jgi:hypothetical protein
MQLIPYCKVLYENIIVIRVAVYASWYLMSVLMRWYRLYVLLTISYMLVRVLAFNHGI